MRSRSLMAILNIDLIDKFNDTLFAILVATEGLTPG